MEQINKHSNGGFAILEIEISGYSGTFAAWFDCDGELIEAEQRIPKAFGYTTRPLQPSGFARRYIEQKGKHEANRLKVALIVEPEITERWDMCD